MFSLIFTLISIILVVALVAAMIYFAGPAYQNASDGAVVDQLMNQGAQIRGAFESYQVNNLQAAPDIATLQSSQYLSAIPPNWTLNASNPTVAYTAVVSDDVCLKFNAKYGVIGVPSCSTVQPNTPICCQ